MPSLNQKLAELKVERTKKIPVQKQHIMKVFANKLDLNDFETHSLQVGATISSFSLPNALNQEFTVAAQGLNKPLVVIFYRGGWCPYCNLTLRELNARIDEILKYADVITISPMTPDASLDLKEKNELKFEVLSDHENKVAKQFGIVFKLDNSVVEIYTAAGYDLKQDNDSKSFELPIPATFIFDTSGVLVKKHVDPDYTKRMDFDEVIKIIETL